jgi:hypothetical protein
VQIESAIVVGVDPGGGDPALGQTELRGRGRPEAAPGVAQQRARLPGRCEDVLVAVAVEVRSDNRDCWASPR